MLDGTLELGVDVLMVQEVIRFQAMTPVPLAPPAVRGLINLRGQIVTAVDLRTRFDLPRAARSDRPPTNVVVKADEGAIALLVDEIGDVVEVGDDTFESPPDTVAGPPATSSAGVHKLEGRLLLVLDAHRALDVRSHAA